MSEPVRTISEPRRGRKRRDTDTIRRDLLAAATELFVRKGPDAVNSNQIARAAGVGVGTFYSHYRDKHEIHQAILLETLESLQSELASDTDIKNGSLDEQVLALVTRVVDFAARNPDRFRVAFGPEAPSRRASPDAEKGARPQVGFSTRATERRLAALQREGVLDPALHPEIAARGFVAMQNGVLSWWLDEPARATRQQIIDTLVRLHPAFAARVTRTPLPQSSV